MDKRLTRQNREILAKLADGLDLGVVVHSIVRTLDPDQQLAAAAEAGIAPDDTLYGELWP